MKGDMSPNCPACGANPHEECRMPIHDVQAINCARNPVALDSIRDDKRESSMLEALDEGKAYIKLKSTNDKAINAGFSILKMNPRLPKDGALDGVLNVKPNPPAMHAGMPRDPDLLARLKRMYGDNPMKKPKEQEDFDPETAKYGINNLE
tara:strand:+ start:1537 stop:1986 length:450 start_codon:yes stop_codon:yes gene_type:complete